MRFKALISLLLTSVVLLTKAQDVRKAELWLTNSDRSNLFSRQRNSPRSGRIDRPNTIVVNEKKAYQTIDGFGFALTGGSATHIIRMSPDRRMSLLRELFGIKDDGIGISYLRVSIGSSDLNEKAYSYDDLAEGETDTTLGHFSLDPDKENVIPVLKEILSINPSVKILASPWSPPAWMKTNGDTKGGQLKPEYYGVYARYFVKYIQAMQREGISIDAVTVQNEPLHPGNNPSLLMVASDQALFVKKYLGAAFRSAGIHTKIIIYDHNADRPDYPISILDDPEARKYIDGSAFHLYAGKIDALAYVHERHPDKNIYFTEQWIGYPSEFKEDIKWHVRELIIGATRNWSRNVIEWNLAADPQLRPYTDRGGCDRCLGDVTIDKDSVTRNPSYYIIAHASKFVRPGSRRVESNYIRALPNVAFRTAEGVMVLIVLNNTNTPQSFSIQHRNKILNSSLKGGAVGTYVWRAY